MRIYGQIPTQGQTADSRSKYEFKLIMRVQGRMRIQGIECEFKVKMRIIGQKKNKIQKSDFTQCGRIVSW